MTLAFLTTPLLGLTDTAVVGRIGDAAALGGLAVGSLIFDFAFATCNFLRSGTTGLTAQAVGVEDDREVQAVFWRAAILAAAIGLALVVTEPALTALGLLAIAPGPEVAETVRTYVFVRMFSAPFALFNYAVLGHVLGRGHSTLGLALQLVVNGTNIALSILFGLVLDWGVGGVALGTVCGEAVGALVGLLAVLGGFAQGERPSWQQIVDRTGFVRMVAVNRDIMIRSLCLLSAFALFTRIGASFGAGVLAANGLLMNLFMIGSFFLDGMATAAEQLIGRAVGARWRPAFDRATRLTIAWGLGLGVLMAVVFAAGGRAVIAFLTTDQGVRGTAGDYLFWAAATPLSGALAFIMDGVFIGATWSGTMRDMMIISLALFVAAAYALTPLLGNHGLWLAMVLFLGVRGLSLLAALPARRRRSFPDPADAGAGLHQ
ncbi:MATE family efflux transporter [Aurantimonas sp. VKM B-3413]|uniref:MATE family efflux transporter n=1 Tax=Aurantimonas sp. VKM B-3413 TaxID=2779401 RepID=UPI001E57988F|nr:MATE family efflux transporter [Aurantimonas sp. VKM B-3413]MCB8839517.1 MATE family efflux transporter [Aurantimonas sp. VKM B-3413]